ncbi:hypothetical protein WDZ92_43290, partial [Nostoc sp. NIES-2111]
MTNLKTLALLAATAVVALGATSASASSYKHAKDKSTAHTNAGGETGGSVSTHPGGIWLFDKKKGHWVGYGSADATGVALGQGAAKADASTGKASPSADTSAAAGISLDSTGNWTAEGGLTLAGFASGSSTNRPTTTRNNTRTSAERGGQLRGRTHGHAP